MTTESLTVLFIGLVNLVAAIGAVWNSILNRKETQANKEATVAVARKVDVVSVATVATKNEVIAAKEDAKIDAEAKDQKIAEVHQLVDGRLTKFLEQHEAVLQRLAALSGDPGDKAVADAAAVDVADKKVTDAEVLAGKTLREHEAKKAAAGGEAVI